MRAEGDALLNLLFCFLLLHPCTPHLHTPQEVPASALQIYAESGAAGPLLTLLSSACTPTPNIPAGSACRCCSTCCG